MTMAKLISKTRGNLQLLGDLRIAGNFWTRGKGLLGRTSLGAEEALWLLRANSIHTWFMSMPIDCVFLDRQLKIRAIRENVRPWGCVWPIWGATSVLEMKSGDARRLGLHVGEELHVGH